MGKGNRLRRKAQHQLTGTTKTPNHHTATLDLGSGVKLGIKGPTSSESRALRRSADKYACMSNVTLDELIMSWTSWYADYAHEHGVFLEGFVSDGKVNDLAFAFDRLAAVNGGGQRCDLEKALSCAQQAMKSEQGLRDPRGLFFVMTASVVVAEGDEKKYLLVSEATAEYLQWGQDNNHKLK